jgi:hypothetical protein
LKESEGVRLRCFYHCADALGAERLLGLRAILINSHLLQIRQELAIGSPQGEGTIVTESGRFAAVSAFSHLKIILSCYNTVVPLGSSAKFYHKAHPSTSTAT